MAFLMGRKTLHVTHFERPGQCVIAPRRGWSSTAPHDPSATNHVPAERTRANFLFLPDAPPFRGTVAATNTTLHRYRGSSSAVREIAALCIAAFVAHACFHQQHADLVSSSAPSRTSRLRLPRVRRRSRMRWRHVALRQKITAQAVAILLASTRSFFLFRRRNGPVASADEPPSTRGMWLQVIVDPPGEDRGFHRRGPRLRPAVFIQRSRSNAWRGSCLWA